MTTDPLTRRAAPGRSPIHAMVSDAAHSDWHDTAATHGVSVSAIVEAMAPRLAGILADHEKILFDARRVDADGRRRTGHR